MNTANTGGPEGAERPEDASKVAPGQRPPAAPGEPVKALHGSPSELRWNEGEGRQPYENQDPDVPPDPGAAEVPDGDRGAASGRNLEDLEKVREKWRDSP